MYDNCLFFATIDLFCASNATATIRTTVNETVKHFWNIQLRNNLWTIHFRREKKEIEQISSTHFWSYKRICVSPLLIAPAIEGKLVDLRKYFFLDSSVCFSFHLKTWLYFDACFPHQFQFNMERYLKTEKCCGCTGEYTPTIHTHQIKWFTYTYKWTQIVLDSNLDLRTGGKIIGFIGLIFGALGILGSMMPKQHNHLYEEQEIEHIPSEYTLLSTGMHNFISVYSHWKFSLFQPKSTRSTFKTIKILYLIVFFLFFSSLSIQTKVIYSIVSGLLLYGIFNVSANNFVLGALFTSWNFLCNFSRTNLHLFCLQL